LIDVANLTKRYGSTIALDNISFNVEKGEVVGLLGPNGAGKTTIIRILSCFLSPTEGKVDILGLNSFTDSLEIRRNIGYLPENNPLYPEMRVNEFLKFRAALKKVPRKKLRSRMDEVLSRCELTEVRHRVIGTLSKGFKQRVGLADALVHDPKLLILDEPTSGLDPNQVRQVRDLITDLGKERTVILSSHILPEVEATCSRVLILNKGKIVAMDSAKNLISRLSHHCVLSVEVKAPIQETREIFGKLPHVLKCEGFPLNGWNRFELSVKEGHDLREELFHLVREKGWSLRELKGISRNLEDVFVHITTVESTRS